MKDKDIVVVIIIVALSGVISYFVSNAFIAPPEKNLKAAKVERIDKKFNEPSSVYFNSQSINPTQLIRIDENKNDNPVNK